MYAIRSYYARRSSPARPAVVATPEARHAPRLGISRNCFGPDALQLKDMEERDMRAKIWIAALLGALILAAPARNNFV